MLNYMSIKEASSVVNTICNIREKISRIKIRL